MDKELKKFVKFTLIVTLVFAFVPASIFLGFAFHKDETMQKRPNKYEVDGFSKLRNKMHFTKMKFPSYEILQQLVNTANNIKYYERTYSIFRIKKAGYDIEINYSYGSIEVECLTEYYVTDTSSYQKIENINIELDFIEDEISECTKTCFYTDGYFYSILIIKFDVESRHEMIQCIFDSLIK